MPNPSKLDYAVVLLGNQYRDYVATVSSIESPVAFQGSAVELLTDALLALPKQFDFNVTAKPFAKPVDDNRDGARAPDVSLPKWAASHLNCDKATHAAEMVLCERRAKFAPTLCPGSPWDAAASTAATVSPLYRRHPKSPPVNREHEVPEEAYPGKYAPQPYEKVVRGDAYGPKSHFAVGHYPTLDKNNVALIPQTLTSLSATVTPTDLSINATGDLTQDDFKQSCKLLIVPWLSLFGLGGANTLSIRSSLI